MKVYDTLIIGSGYTSLGYAIARGDTVICEDGELCDTGFSMPVRCFALPDYEPKNILTRELFDYYRSLGIIGGGMQNTGALECGFCGFALKHNVEILLKCRVIDKRVTEDGAFDVSVIGGGGIEHILAERVLDMRQKRGERWLTVLFKTENPDSDISTLRAAFEGSKIEPAFYESRYALHIPCHRDEDINEARLRLYHLWDTTEHTARLLYTAPALAVVSDNLGGTPTDADFDSFLSAFDGGVDFAHADRG